MKKLVENKLRIMVFIGSVLYCTRRAEDREDAAWEDRKRIA